jgi:glyoxylase-like metal-dependent hydrolase (beta-lactamase superfamily II)
MNAGPASGIRYPVSEPPEPGEAREIAPGILWLRLPLPMALTHVNVYALDDGDGWTIVDTGLGTDTLRGLWEKILAGPLSGRPLRRVIVTHHHPDHIGLAGWFQEIHGAELWTTRTAWLYARMLTLDEQTLPVPRTIAFWRGAGMPSEMLAQRAGERPFNFRDVVDPLPLGFRRIAEGDALTAGGRTWDIRIGNGHAPEHATLWSRDGEIVIGGDQLLPSISPNLGTYATEPEGDPVGEWLEACARLSGHATPDQLVLPGHKLPYRGLPTRLLQLAQNHAGALDRLRAFLSRPRTAVECFQPLFLREIGPGEFGLAMVEAMAHVLHLWHLGEVRRTRRDDGAWLWQIAAISPAKGP